MFVVRGKGLDVEWLLLELQGAIEANRGHSLGGKTLGHRSQHKGNEGRRSAIGRSAGNMAARPQAAARDKGASA